MEETHWNSNPHTSFQAGLTPNRNPMELTLTENGALFALQRGAGKKRRSAHRNRASGLKIIRTGGKAPEIWAVRKTKTENICFT